MARAGFVAPHWPEPWGLGAGPTEQLELDLVARELAVPRPAEPDRNRLGRTDAARRRFRGATARWLPGILDGSELWCQLFSEPGRRERPVVARDRGPCATATSTS